MSFPGLKRRNTRRGANFVPVAPIPDINPCRRSRLVFCRIFRGGHDFAGDLLYLLTGISELSFVNSHRTGLPRYSWATTGNESL